MSTIYVNMCEDIHETFAKASIFCITINGLYK